MFADHSSKSDEVSETLFVSVILFVTILWDMITSVDVRFGALPKSLEVAWMHESLTLGIPAKRVDLFEKDRSFFIKHGATIMPAKFKYKTRGQTGSVFKKIKDPVLKKAVLSFLEKEGFRKESFPEIFGE